MERYKVIMKQLKFERAELEVQGSKLDAWLMKMLNRLRLNPVSLVWVINRTLKKMWITKVLRKKCSKMRILKTR